MSSFIYDKARESFLKGDFNVAADTLKVVLVHIGASHYITAPTTDQFLSDISAGDRIATTSALTSIGTAAGVLDAADTVFAAVASGPAAGAIVLYKDTGTAGTSRLIAYIDSYAGLPITPNGADINLAWPNDANKICKL